MAKMTDMTICGLIYEGGVILGVDKRVSMQEVSGGDTLSYPGCNIYRLSEKIYCCCDGSSTDAQRIRQMLQLVETDLELEFFNTEVSVSSSVNTLTREMHRCQDYLTSAFIIGGVDATGGPQLFSVFHGSALVRTHAHKFCAKGSALQPAMEILKSGWTENISEKSGLELIVNAVTEGKLYDLGYEGNVDVIVIRNNGELCTYKVCKAREDGMCESLLNDPTCCTTEFLNT